MDNLNLRNLQLSYEAVYDETLCESMDDLGLFGEYDYIDEGRKPFPYEKVKTKARKVGNQWLFSDPMNKSNDRFLKRYKKMKSEIDKTRQEEVELYDLILEYLLDEGYTEDIDGAEAIIENMSDEWLETILDEAQVIMSVTSPKGKRRALNFAKAKPSRELTGLERRKAALDMRQKGVDRRAPSIEKKLRRRYNLPSAR